MVRSGPASASGHTCAALTGLGGGNFAAAMTNVKQVVEAMRERVDFAARDGGGLIVTLRAPIN